MDYSTQFQFAGAQPYTSFMPIQPLTPSHSQSAASDEFNNTSPPVRFYPSLCFLTSSSRLRRFQAASR